jgi:hypothetical protein
MCSIGLLATTFCGLATVTVACGCSSSSSSSSSSEDGSTGGDSAPSSDGGGGRTMAGDAASSTETGATLSISPHIVTVAEGGTTKFSCNVACTFALKEGASGGSVATDGTYTAPNAMGVFHVVASSSDGQTDTATVTVPAPATGTPGMWESVTAPQMPATLFTGSGGFGAGNVVQDPKRPTDMFVGGYGSTWQSTDYGLHWTEVQSNPVPPYGPLGHVLAIADDNGTTATLWNASAYGAQKVYRSTDGGLTFTLTGTLSGGPDASLYSIVVDPYDSTHLVSGFHETDGLAESTDAGDTWNYVGQTGWPSGGISWFPFFLDTGEAKTTRTTWLAIAQNGGSLCTTADGGAHWTIPTGVGGLNHPHGNAGILQLGTTLFVGGTHSDGVASVGDGVYTSVDLGVTWTQVNDHGAGVVFGSTKYVYAMWSWACAQCTWDATGIAVQDMMAAQPGTTWTSAAAAANGLNWGPNSVATTSDGVHTIYVGSMWSSGMWRYVEP